MLTEITGDGMTRKMSSNSRRGNLDGFGSTIVSALSPSSECQEESVEGVDQRFGNVAVLRRKVTVVEYYTNGLSFLFRQSKDVDEYLSLREVSGFVVHSS